jgi:SpoVK/Ycf46/Vps4 family AAA+-type ATPase
MPAVIERAAKVVKSIRQANPSMDVGVAFSRIAGNTLEAMGIPREARACVSKVTDYRPELLNTNCDLSSVRSGLKQEGKGRLCFFGPSGTGKTAYGRFLAEELDRPLLLRRASDLQSPWLGVAEKNMARMFEEAKLENAVLLLDEADSFLQDRRGARQSWEVSQVNEMLTQMESFEGIFIASTNLMDSLDEAALRRFDLRVRFDYLKHDQAWAMFQDAAKRLRLEGIEEARVWLRPLQFVTPGDFATVIRQARLNPMKDAKMLAERLRAECEAKFQGRRKLIGF